MPLDALVREGQIIAQTFWFVRSIEALDRTDHAVKFRLHIDRDLFIQVYVNIEEGKDELRADQWRSAYIW